MVRSNIQAHTRFGCARDGETVFDEDKYGRSDGLGLAMAEIFTGIELLPEHAASLSDAQWFKGPCLAYPGNG